MTPERFEEIIRTTTLIWDINCELKFSENQSSCFLLRGEDKFSISHEIASFGAIWRITRPDGKERVHPSIGSMFNSLSRLLRPDQPKARVIFAR